MRPDMGRLIIEDGRRGNGGPKTMYDKIQRAGEEYENLPAHESMSRHRKQDQNSQGDRLAPLRKFLHSNVGRPWNKVYSEICEVNDRRNIRGYHLLTHLKQYVQIKQEYGFYNQIRWREFYVDAHGLLKKSKDLPSWRVRHKKPVETTKIPIAENEWYEKFEGLWYRMTKTVRHWTAPVWPEEIIERKGRLGLMVKPKETEVVKKIACGKKEIRKIQSLLRVV